MNRRERRAKKKAKKNIAAVALRDDTSNSVRTDTAARDAAEVVAGDYQSTIDLIREGRKESGFKVAELWNHWYNNLMAICFTLGGALLAVESVIPRLRLNHALFWFSILLLIGDGLYILLLRKRTFENESVKLINMGYELEYYSIVARNRVQDVLAGAEFQETEYEDAKNEMLKLSLAGIDKNNKEVAVIDERVDIITALFVLGLIALAISTFTGNIHMEIAGIIGLILWLILLLYFRGTRQDVKNAGDDRKTWDEKIKEERNRERNK